MFTVPGQEGRRRDSIEAFLRRLPSRFAENVRRGSRVVRGAQGVHPHVQCSSPEGAAAGDVREPRDEGPRRPAVVGGQRELLFLFRDYFYSLIYRQLD